MNMRKHQYDAIQDVILTILQVYGVSVILLVNIRSELSKGYVALFKRVRWLSQLPKYLAFIGM